MIFNELHIDPASDITGDANGDGTRDAIADEFIELVNNGSSAFDLSGYYLTDSEEPNSAARHIFPQGTIAPPKLVGETGIPPPKTTTA